MSVPAPPPVPLPELHRRVPPVLHGCLAASVHSAFTTASRVWLLPGPMLLAKSVAGKHSGCRWIIGHLSIGGDLIYLLDSTSGLHFLVDTGSSRSVFPHHSSAPPSGPQLITAGGTHVPAWGVRKFNLSFSSRKFTFPFILGKVSYPILGNDFLAAHNLVVDPACCQVFHKPSHTLLYHSPPTSLPSPSTPFLSSLDSFPPTI